MSPLHCPVTQLTRRIRYLRDLQKLAYNWQRTNGVKRSRDVAFPEDDLDDRNVLDDFGAAEEFVCPRPTESPPAETDASSTCNIWTSPFTLPTTVMKDSCKRQRKWSE